jgi:hypothetical protein
MKEMWEFIKFLLNSEEIVAAGGLILVTLIVYAETGVFFCFFLPGDYLLFTAGMFCGLGTLPVPVVVLLFSLFAAAVAGNYTGYFFGRYLGGWLMKRKDLSALRRQCPHYRAFSACGAYVCPYSGRNNPDVALPLCCLQHFRCPSLGSDALPAGLFSWKEIPGYNQLRGIHYTCVYNTDFGGGVQFFPETPQQQSQTRKLA